MNRLTEVRPGFVKVTPRGVHALDVLEMAEALIEAYGWRQGPYEGLPDLQGKDSGPADAGKIVGFSLHDAIGGACEELGRDTGGVVNGGKEGKTYRPGAAQPGHLRREANEFLFAAIEKADPSLTDHRRDITFNDNAQSVEPVLAVLRDAIEEASK